MECFHDFVLWFDAVDGIGMLKNLSVTLLTEYSHKEISTQQFLTLLKNY